MYEATKGTLTAFTNWLVKYQLETSLQPIMHYLMLLDESRDEFGRRGETEMMRGRK